MSFHDGGKLTTTEEILKNFSVNLRMASYIATDCSNHLAVHSTGQYATILYTIAQDLARLAEVVREVGVMHDRSSPSQA